MKSITVFGELLGHLRIDAKLTRGEFAAKLKVTPNYLSAVMAGRKLASDSLVSEARTLAWATYPKGSRTNAACFCNLLSRYAQVANGEADIFDLDTEQRRAVVALIDLMVYGLVDARAVNTLTKSAEQALQNDLMGMR